MSKFVAESINQSIATDCRMFRPHKPSSTAHKTEDTVVVLDAEHLATSLFSVASVLTIRNREWGLFHLWYMHVCFVHCHLWRALLLVTSYDSWPYIISLLHMQGNLQSEYNPLAAFTSHSSGVESCCYSLMYTVTTPLTALPSHTRMCSWRWSCLTVQCVLDMSVMCCLHNSMCSLKCSCGERALCMSSLLRMVSLHTTAWQLSRQMDSLLLCWPTTGWQPYLMWSVSSAKCQACTRCVAWCAYM